MKRIFAITYLVVLFSLSLVVPFLFPDLGTDIDLDKALILPSGSYWFGTDSLGRDLMFRVLIGAKTTVFVGVTSALISILLGSLIGIGLSLLPRFLEHIFLRFVEVVDSVPSVIWVCLLFVSFYKEGSSLLFMIVAMFSVGWISSAKISRIASHKIISAQYIEAAQAMGVSKLRLIFKHIFPNMQESVISIFCYQLTYFFIFDSVLSFYGFGIQPPGLSWGVLILDGWKSIAFYPHLLVCPSAVLFVTILSLNIIIRSLKRENQ